MKGTPALASTPNRSYEMLSFQIEKKSPFGREKRGLDETGLHCDSSTRCLPKPIRNMAGRFDEPLQLY
jgi:hypothetical protein